jgi:hypothetical protein
MGFVLERRRAFWPNPQTRAEAARLYAEGMQLREVLERYPNEVISVSGASGVGQRDERSMRIGRCSRRAWVSRTSTPTTAPPSSG